MTLQQKIDKQIERQIRIWQAIGDSLSQSSPDGLAR